MGCVLVALFSYLLGSVNWAVIISKVFFQKDIRTFGSGNAGMTNMLRTFGKLPAAFCALGDFGKGILAVAVSRVLFVSVFGQLPFDVGYLAGIFTVLGHMFPVYFHFKGGKGVLTALGMIAVLDWRVFLIVFAVCLILLIFTRIVSLASITGAVLYPVATYVVHRSMGTLSYPNLALATGIALTVLYMHRENIGRLIRGEEYRFGKPKK